MVLQRHFKLEMIVVGLFWSEYLVYVFVGTFKKFYNFFFTYMKKLD